MQKTRNTSQKVADCILNQTLACRYCNAANGNTEPEEWPANLKQSKKTMNKFQAETSTCGKKKEWNLLHQ